MFRFLSAAPLGDQISNTQTLRVTYQTTAQTKMPAMGTTDKYYSSKALENG